MSEANRVSTSEFDDITYEIDYTMLERYVIAESTVVGNTFLCAYCGKTIVKRTYQQKFCNNKCKDKYWNTVDKKRRNRAKVWSSK